METLLSQFSNSQWYEIAAYVVSLAAALTAAVPAPAKNKPLKIAYQVVNFLAFNIFNAKNADKKKASAK